MSIFAVASRRRVSGALESGYRVTRRGHWSERPTARPIRQDGTLRWFGVRDRPAGKGAPQRPRKMHIVKPLCPWSASGPCSARTVEDKGKLDASRSTNLQLTAHSTPCPAAVQPPAGEYCPRGLFFPQARQSLPLRGVRPQERRSDCNFDLPQGVHGSTARWESQRMAPDGSGRGEAAASPIAEARGIGTMRRRSPASNPPGKPSWHA